MNTCLAVGEPLNDPFAAWRAYVARQPDLAVGALLKRAVPFLNEREIAAYDAPFPDARYKAGVRAFPALVMTDRNMSGVAESRAARVFWGGKWSGRSLMACGAADPIFTPAHMEALRSEIQNCPPALVLPEAGHFIQEWGGQVAAEAVRVLVA